MKPIFIKLSSGHKHFKGYYYAISYARQLFPGKIFQLRLERKISALKDYDIDYIRRRVNYYNKLEEYINLPDSVRNLEHFKRKKKGKTYFFDSCEYTRYFHPSMRMEFRFGDVTYVPEEPAIVKSRPINGDNINSVLLKLNKIRHFTFINDKKYFLKKKNMLVGRNFVDQAHRLRFLEMYNNNPLCNIGMINKDDHHLNLLKEKLTIEEQLDYKFILCLEGNDVASNLKWVMSSNSLAVMPAPKYEIWFMEGTLIPNYHYVLIKDDYSDLEERMDYYINHTDEALEIIKNANKYVEPFKVRQREDLISLLVLEKYFYKTNQITYNEDLEWVLSPEEYQPESAILIPAI